MKKIFLLIFVSISMNIFAQETGIKFIEDQTLTQLLQKAKLENKLLFIDCYTSWCGPCKYLSKNIFPTKEVGDYYNANFVCGKFDMEKGEGVDIAVKYKVRAYPTLLFLDANGDIAHLKVGAGDAKDILNLGQLAGDKNNNYKALLAKLNKGDLSPEIIDKFLDVNPYASNKDSLINKYFSTLKAQDKISVSSWNMINKYVEDYNNTFFKFLLGNEEKFKKVADPKEVENKIYQIFIYYIAKNAKSESKSAEIKKELTDLNNPQVAKAYRYMKFSALYSQVAKGELNADNWKAFISGSKEYLNTDGESNGLNNVAWFVYENYKKVNDKEALKLAKEWAMKSIQQKKDVNNLDTYANIVFDLGEFAEAIKYEGEAIDFANKTNDSEMVKSLTERLEYFKNNSKQ